MLGKYMKPKKRVLIGYGIIWLLVATFSASAQSVILVDDDAADGGDGTTWALAYNNLQSALAVTVPGDELRVAQGLYIAPKDAVEGLFVDGFILTSDIKVLGGFAGLGPCGSCDPNLRDPELFMTILSGDTNNDDASSGNRSDNRFHVLFADSLSMETILDGLTITAGNANGTVPERQQGGGLTAANSVLTIRDCTFLDNSAAMNGGGMNVANGVTNIIDCRFENNSSAQAGGGLDYGATVTGSLTIIRSTFSDNFGSSAGGGINFHTSDSPVLTDCLFINNFSNSTGGGIAGLSNDMSLTNCLFMGNTAGNFVSFGGAIQVVAFNPHLTNCTIVANHAGTNGGIFILGGTATLENCILWNNTEFFKVVRPEGEEIRNDALSSEIGISSTGSVPTINYSDIQGYSGEFGGMMNINLDPLFVDDLVLVLDGLPFPVTGDEDFRLTSGSPCINAGSDAAVPADIFNDLDGNIRFKGAVDMGAYEFAGAGDADGDGIADVDDNCPSVFNPDQADFDLDGIGDVCDSDNDNDGITDELDNCPLIFNPNQLNFDGDMLGDVCDDDDDNDGLTDAVEIALAVGGSCPDPLNPDSDDDGIVDGDDPFPCNTKPIASTALLQLTYIGSDAQVRLDGTASSDSDDDALTFEWFIDGMRICFGDRTSCALIEVGLAFKGTFEVTLRVSDADESDEVTKSISITASALSTFEIDQVDVKFETGPTSTMKIRGEIGLPLGVSVSELDPIAFLRVAAGGVEVLPFWPVIFTVTSGKRSIWEFLQDPGGPGLVKFDIDWKGARFRFKEKNFPIELKSQLITTSRTDLTLKFKRKKLGGPVMIDIGGMATINIDADGNVTSDVVVETVKVGKEYTLVLPFPLIHETVITVTGSQNRTILAGDYLRASVGRFGIDLLFDSAAFPDGASTLPRTIDVMLNVGAQMYFGDTFLDETDISVKKNKWKSKGR